MDLPDTSGVHSLPDELLMRVFSLVLLELEDSHNIDGMLRSVPLWLHLVCKRWQSLLSGPSSLFAEFCVQLAGRQAVSSSAMRVLLARLGETRALKIECTWNEQSSAHEAVFARLLCSLDSLPMLESLHIDVNNFDLTSEQQLGMRSIAQLSSLRSLNIESLDCRELQLLQGYSALSCLTSLRLELWGDDAVEDAYPILLPPFVLQLQRLQSLALNLYEWGAGYVLPKVNPVACPSVLLLYRDPAGGQNSC